MKTCRSIRLAFFFVLLTTWTAAQDLQLIPEPREVQRQSGAFEVTAAVRLVVGAKHAGEDRFAAETIAEEIARQTGRKVHRREDHH